ncbi:MAG: hypothetical protein ACREIV_08110 [Planctomycetaceae bacterium]
MARLVTCPVLMVLACAGRLSAQAPVITAAGDPSVDADTIYSLAADSAVDDDAAVFLFDDGVIRIDATGAARGRTVRWCT